MAATPLYAFPAVFSLSSSSSSTTTTTGKARGLISSIPCPKFFRPNFNSSSNLKPLVRIAHGTSGAPNYAFRVPIVSCNLDDSHSDAHVELGSSSISNDSHTEATAELKPLRRSLLVHFTCNACGERTQKLINRLAYERGTVFVQCAGCFQHHKLVDNLGLVVEYDFRENMEMDSHLDQV